MVPWSDAYLSIPFKGAEIMLKLRYIYASIAVPNDETKKGYVREAFQKWQDATCLTFTEISEPLTTNYINIEDITDEKCVCFS